MLLALDSPQGYEALVTVIAGDVDLLVEYHKWVVDSTYAFFKHSMENKVRGAVGLF